YVDPAPGTASFNVLKLVRFELHMELKRALQQALSEQLRVETEVSFQGDGKHSVVRLDVIPLQDPDSQTRCLLVLFHRMPPPREVPVVASEEGKTAETLLPLAQ